MQKIEASQWTAGPRLGYETLFSLERKLLPKSFYSLIFPVSRRAFLVYIMKVQFQISVGKPESVNSLSGSKAF